MCVTRSDEQENIGMKVCVLLSITPDADLQSNNLAMAWVIVSREHHDRELLVNFIHTK